MLYRLYLRTNFSRKLLIKFKNLVIIRKAENKLIKIK